MVFLWKHIFILVKRMWDLSQADIANYWGVHRSTISKLKNGTQSQFNRPCIDLYRKLFDPTNPQSPVHGKHPKSLMKGLKEEIEDAGWTDVTKALKDDDYEKFVVGLFRLAKENQSKLSTKEVAHNDTTKNKSNGQKTLDMQPEQMPDNCLEEKEYSTSKASPFELYPFAPASGNITSDSDEVEDTSPNTEATGTQDETVSSDTNGTDSSIGSGGAQISIPDKYRRCVFCIYWTGNASDAYKSKTGVSGMCKLYHRVQRSTDRIDCRDYEPNEARISKQILLSQ